MKTYFINNNESSWTNSEMAKVTTKPALIYGSAPEYELHFVESNNEGGSIGVDLSNAVAFRAAIDNDWSHSTTPMVRVLSSDFDTTGAASGVLKLTLDTVTEQFASKINGKQNVPAWLEVAGLDENNKAIYCWQLPIIAQNSIDPQIGE